MAAFALPSLDLESEDFESELFDSFEASEELPLLAALFFLP